MCWNVLEFGDGGSFRIGALVVGRQWAVSATACRLAVYWVQPSADCIGIQVPAHRTLLRNGFRLTVGCISHRPPLAATVTDATADDRLFSSRPLLAWSVHGRAAHFPRHRARRCSRRVTRTAPKGACTAHFSNN